MLCIFLHDLQVFLEPFSRVLGQAKSKQVLITVAQSDSRDINCLHRLGILLGITDWVKDYQKKLNPPQNQICNSHSAHVEPAKVRIQVRKIEKNSIQSRLDESYLKLTINTSAFKCVDLGHIIFNILNFLWICKNCVLFYILSRSICEINRRNWSQCN